MNDSAPLSVVEVLVLTRLLPVGEKGETRVKIQKDLEPLLAHRWSGSVLADVLERALIKLSSRGLVASAPVAPGGKGKGRAKAVEPKYVLSAPGRQQALHELGVESLGPKTTWAVLKKSHLPARALGQKRLDASALKTLGSDTGLKAAFLKSAFELPLAARPTLLQATDALAWKLMGVETTEKFSVKAVQKTLFQKALGDPSARPADAKKAVDLLLVRRAGARNNQAKEFRDAVLRRWVDQSLGGPEPVTASPSAQALDLPRFAGRVLAASRACTTGRYGESKVFIAHVWRLLRDDPEFRGMDFPTFKRHLGEANNARLLDLSRADLVQAMDPEDVHSSEVEYMNARFHFIRIDPERQ
jgi:hypothetical protein